MSYGFGNKETRWFLKGGPAQIDFSMLKCSEEHLEFVRKTAIFLPSPFFWVVAVANVFFYHCQFVFISSSGNFFNAKHMSKTQGFSSDCLKKGGHLTFRALTVGFFFAGSGQEDEGDEDEWEEDGEEEKWNEAEEDEWQDWKQEKWA